MKKNKKREELKYNIFSSYWIKLKIQLGTKSKELPSNQLLKIFLKKYFNIRLKLIKNIIQYAI